jgi:flagellar hook-length control protein FliK
MNAAIAAIRPPVIAVAPQAPPEQPQSAPTSADPTANPTGPRDFAGALDRVSARQSRRDDSSKQGAGKRSGDALPPSGSVTPPASATHAVAPAPPALLGPNGAPVAPPESDEEGGDDRDTAEAPAVAGVSTGAAGAATPRAALSSSAGVDPGGTPAAASRSPQGAAGVEGAVFDDTDTGTVVVAGETESGTGTESATRSDDAAATSAASGSTQASDASAALAAAAPAPKSSGAATSIDGIATTRSSASGLSLRTASSASGAAGASASGRASTQTDSPSAAAAPADDDAAAAQDPVASSTLTDLALSEGSDATGSAASALQAAYAAASSPPSAADTNAGAASPLAALQISLMPTEDAGSASSGSVLDTVALSSAAVVSLGSGGDTRGHNGAGAFGADTGSGFLANGDGAAALQQLSTSTASSSSAAAPTVSVHANVDSADFPQGVADKVSLAVENGWSSAKLSMNPPQLGPIELQIAVQGAHAQVAMSTHSAVTREALESSVPKLRDLLNSQGFTQVSVDISQRSFQERSAPELPYGRPSNGMRGIAPISSASAQVPRAPLGMLDIYA